MPRHRIFAASRGEALGVVKYVRIILIVLVAILALMRVISGVGMLKVQEWARKLGLVYGGLALVYQAYNVIVQLTIMPRMMEQMQAVGFPTQAMQAGMSVGLVINTLISVLLHGALIYALALPDVAKAFRARPGTETPFDLGDSE